MASWGLGLKRLSFLHEASSAEMDTVAHDSFLKLGGCGYEFLRSGPRVWILTPFPTPIVSFCVPAWSSTYIPVFFFQYISLLNKCTIVILGVYGFQYKVEILY